MRKITIASLLSFGEFARASRWEQFFCAMEAVVRWSELEALTEPYYPKAGEVRQPIGLSAMLAATVRGSGSQLLIGIQ